jgi:NADPH:quinone reductase-like Zn-dependent oxidoreductase
MQKIEYDKYGGPELMRLEEVEPPVPGKGRLLVRVRAAAANPMDWKIRNGAVKLRGLSASTRSSASNSILKASKTGSTSSSTQSARCRSALRARCSSPAAASSTST